MTEEEKDRLRAKKVETVGYLRSLDLSDWRLDEVDGRLSGYVSECVGHPERHNLFELLAVGKFLRMATRYGINATAVLQFFTLYESLYFPGKMGPTRYRLTPVQCFQFASIFAFWKNGYRVVREVCLYVPRKFTKTTQTAALAVYDVLYGDANAEVYTGANSEDQALKCFEVIKGCFQKLDPTEKTFKINEKTVRTRMKNRQAFAQCLTANARTKDGLNASTIIMDEFSQAQDSNLLTVLTTSMGVRDNPLTVIITTASDVFEGPFYGMLQGYKRELLGESQEDEALFAHIFEPDVDDDEGDEATWIKVHPHIGVTVSLEFYRQEWKKALRSADQMLAFRTKQLNVYAENERKAWISGSIARSVAIPMALDGLKGRPDAMCAIDLSESDDFSAVTVGIYRKEKQSFYFHTSYFFPEGALPNHPNESLYRTWAEKGYLTLTPGDVIDYRTIVGYILRVNGFVRILQIGYDAWKSQDVINMLIASGAGNALKPVKQTYGNFTAPVESFEHGVKTGRIYINDNPINYYCFGNAILDEDRLENLKPIKRSPFHKIDGVITCLMCLRLFIDFER